MIYIRISEIDEILSALKQTTDEKIALEIFNDFISAVKMCSHAQLVEVLNEHAEHFSLVNGICPKCNEELHIECWNESRGEYQGVPSYERMSRLVCGECGYIDE